MKLNPDKHFSISQETLSTVLDKYGIKDFTFGFINEGIENSSAWVESGTKKFVLRVYSQGKSDENILRELSFQDFLREQNIPIPVVHKNEAGQELTVIEKDQEKWQAILMDFVEGSSITVHPSSGLVSELATFHAKMHLLGMEFAQKNELPKVPWTELREGHAYKVENTTVGGQEVQDLIQRIKSYQYTLPTNLPYGYNHLDIDFDGNVIIKDAHVSGIIDFDDLKYSPLIVCLGFTLMSILNDEGEDVMRAYLKAYEKVRPLTSEEHEVLPHVVFYRNYILAVIRLLLWEKDTPIEDITDLLQLEQDIPKLFIQS